MKLFFTAIYFLSLCQVFLSSCKREFTVTKNANASNVSTLDYDEQPNIILILADDIGYEVPSYTGGQSYETPNIDFLANNGIQFCEARATPLCSPSRVEFYTGKYNFRNYVDWGILPATNYTIGNLMQSAGYNTCISGKWQLDGGDASIRAFGFQNYLVWNPFNLNNPNEVIGSHYKNPILYSNGETLKYTNNEYGEDLHGEYLFNFIDSSTANNQKFFALGTPNLGHSPFQSTPDDSDYLTASLKSDIKRFPSMIKYFDKKIGLLLSHLDSLNIGENTYILFTTDNGTEQSITSLWKNQKIAGGKGKTLYSWGTHVPFIVYKKNSGIVKIDSSLIDFSDIMPTLSQMSNYPLPANDIFDGVFFWPQIQGMPNSAARTWSFTEFHPQPITLPQKWNRWVEDKNYKRYDSCTIVKKKNNLFRVYTDSLEAHPIKNFTAATTRKNTQFQQILNSMKN